jgi:hypothetical protein
VSPVPQLHVNEGTPLLSECIDILPKVGAILCAADIDPHYPTYFPTRHSSGFRRLVDANLPIIPPQSPVRGEKRSAAVRSYLLCRISLNLAPASAHTRPWVTIFRKYAQVWGRNLVAFSPSGWPPFAPHWVVTKFADRCVPQVLHRFLLPTYVPALTCTHSRSSRTRNTSAPGRLRRSVSRPFVRHAYRFPLLRPFQEVDRRSENSA